MEEIQRQLTKIGELKRELQIRLALLYHGKFRPVSHLEEKARLVKINEELANWYHSVRLCPPRSEEEEACLNRIRALEDQRFQLLEAINGSEVEGYNTHPLDVV